MREIKFRAWDTYKKEMIYLGTLGDISMRRTAGYDDDFANFELMQYTGLKDKNGVEICDGDIIHSKDWDNKHQPCYVRYDAPEFVLIDTENDSWYLNPSLHQDEVIGNIYEDKQLLK